MAEATKAVSMTPRERASIVNILLNSGYDVDAVMAAVDDHQWGALPFLPSDYRTLRCPSCGTMPDKDPFSGRLTGACFGQCRQAEFADDRDRALAGRASRVAAAAKEEEDTAFLSMTRGAVQSAWLDLE